MVISTISNIYLGTHLLKLVGKLDIFHEESVPFTLVISDGCGAPTISFGTFDDAT